MSYCLYIINNEHISKRFGENEDKNVNKTKNSNKYTISGTSFVQTKSETGYIYQMLRDIEFNNISLKNSRLEYQIVSMISSGSNSQNKNMILDHFNYGKGFDGFNIKSILKFEIDLSKLDPNSEVRFPSTTNNIELSCMLNIYQKNYYYISNPSFNINSDLLKSMVL